MSTQRRLTGGLPGWYHTAVPVANERTRSLPPYQASRQRGQPGFASASCRASVGRRLPFERRAARLARAGERARVRRGQRPDASG